MGNARYFRSDWWDLVKVDRAREKLLDREHKEVYQEMVYQEVLEGKKSMQQIADDYGVHKSTVCRIARMRREEG